MATNPRMQAIIDLKDNFSGKMNKVSASMKKTTSSLKKTETQTKRTTKGFSKLVGVVQGLGPMSLAAALGGLYALRKLVTFGKEATAASDIQEKAEARLAAAMKNVAGNTQDSFKELKQYAAQLQKVTTFGDEATISTMAMLSTFQLNSEQIKLLTPRVMDMTAALEKSSGTQQEMETVAIAVGKAMTIGVGSLSRYGVVISDSAKAAFLLADAEGKVQIITEELDKNFKGIARGSAKTLAGSVEQLANSWGDVKENLGEAIRIFGAPFVTALNDATSRLDENNEEVNKLAINATYLSQALLQTSRSLAVLYNTGKTVVTGFADFITLGLFDKLGESVENSLHAIEFLIIDMKKTDVEFENMREQLRNGEKLFKSNAKAAGEIPEEIENAGKAVDDLATKYQNYTQKIEDNNASFLKAQLDRNKSFKERLADMTAEAEIKRLEYSDELNALDRIRQTRKLDTEEQARKLELLKLVKAAAREVELGVGAFGAGGSAGALPGEITSLSGRTDMERFISGFRAEQGQAITEFGAGQEALAKERQGTIINFDFSGANIVDKDKFIAEVMSAINRQSQLAELGAQ